MLRPSPLEPWAGRASAAARFVLSEPQARLVFLDRNFRYLRIQQEPEQEALPIPTSFLLLPSSSDTSAASCDSCRREGMNLKRKVADWLNCELVRGAIAYSAEQLFRKADDIGARAFCSSLHPLHGSCERKTNFQ